MNFIQCLTAMTQRRKEMQGVFNSLRDLAPLRLGGKKNIQR